MPRGRSRRSQALVEAAHAILTEIQPATVRAVCYRLFTLGLIDSMKKAETNGVSVQLTWAREHGVIPWEGIADETREPERVSMFAEPAQFVETVKRSYRRDRWTNQPVRIEIWSEKGTIRGTLAPVLYEYGVTFRVMHGYGSATAIYQAAQESRQQDRPLLVYYVGDWDPSGLHMSEVDLPHRLEEYGAELHLSRLALAAGDCTEALPSFAAETKRQDPRWHWFTTRYGARCWELDALSPPVLRERVERAIVRHLDPDAWERAEVVERAERNSLTDILSAWPGISGQASK